MYEKRDQAWKEYLEVNTALATAIATYDYSGYEQDCFNAGWDAYKKSLFESVALD